MSAQVSNALWLVLALVPAALWMRGAAVGERRNYRRLLGLFVALGVLGFVFSAVSPDDDSIQQVFTQSQKSSVQAPVRSGARGSLWVVASQASTGAVALGLHWKPFSQDWVAVTITPAIVQIRLAADSSPPFSSIS